MRMATAPTADGRLLTWAKALSHMRALRRDARVCGANSPPHRTAAQAAGPAPSRSTAEDGCRASSASREERTETPVTAVGRSSPTSLSTCQPY